MTSDPQPVTRSVRILIISRSEIIRAGLRLLLESRSGLEVVGDVPISDAALTAVRVRPDILLVEIEPGVECDPDLLPELVRSANDAGVLVLTGARDREADCAFVRLGVMGLVTRADPLENLFSAIERVCSGGVWLNRPIMEGILTCAAKRAIEPIVPAESLTVREREVVHLVGEALNNREIAKRLFVAETTVRHHLTSIFGKLGVSSRLELVKYAYCNGLVALGAVGMPPTPPQVRPI